MSCFQKYCPRESNEVFSKYKGSLGEESISEYLAKRIIASREHIRLPAGSESDMPDADLIRWESLVGTARVLVALASYLSEGISLWTQAAREEVSTIVRKAVRYLEIAQQGGKWGEEVDTAVVLQGYLQAFEILGPLCLPQPEIVFQALRWLCDDNQRFPDGSIVHHIEATIHFILALLDICYCWHLPEDLLDASVLDIYDYVI